MDSICIPEPCEKSMAVCGSDESIKGSLERKKARLQRELDTVDKALFALNANPELTNVLELVNKARHC